MSPEDLRKKAKELIDNVKLDVELTKLMERDEYATVAAILKACDFYISRRSVRHKDAKWQEKVQSTNRAFDLMLQVYKNLDNSKKMVFLALCESNFCPATVTLNHDDFVDTFAEKGKIRESLQAEYDAYAQHPFVEIVRRDVRYLPREEALSVLTALWGGSQYTAFLYMYDVLVQMQNKQQRRGDPKFQEETFKDAIATHPGLQLVVNEVTRGTSPLDSSICIIPQMHFIVSNAPEPFDMDVETKEGQEKGAVLESGLWILTAHKTYTGLKEYLSDSIKNMTASAEYGQYFFKSEDDRTYATAANLIAKMHGYLRVVRNFEAPAQNRLRAQVEGIANTAFNATYAMRFIRAQSWAPWMAALRLADGDRSALDTVSYYDAAKILTLHGFPERVSEFLSGISETEKMRKVHEGFKDGMVELMERMKALLQPDTRIDETLNWYENERGFHKDVMMLSLEERKKLAFRDLGNIVMAAVGALEPLELHMMLKTLTHKTVSEDDEQKKEILDQIPLEEFAGLYIEAGDVTRFMRLLKHMNNFNKKSEITDFLSEKIRKAGYSVMESLTIRDLNEIKFDSVFNSGDIMWIRTEFMEEFKTVEQLIAEGDFNNAFVAYEFLEGLNSSKGLKQGQIQQKDELFNFICAEFISRKILRDSKKLGLDEDRTSAYIALLRAHLPAALIEAAANETPEKIVKSKNVFPAAFDRAADNGSISLHHRALNAARMVAGFIPGWKRRSPKI